ncbi:efflux RND transporter periplasmic adaptor subunit [Sphingobacterium sp. LRF_L2]|uniref:efflux RND transporter periplasmic adaptor subunit n=1 Tax=Sphingobacterium sp. LRF_L2 TaxID=3369421 RepID=UPI003F62CE74
MKRFSATMLLGLAAGVSFYSCTASKAEKVEEVATYPVTTAVQIDTSFVKEYVSQIRSVRNIEVRALERGYLEKVYVDEGQYVKAGQLLFRIMPKFYEAELTKAQAEAKAGAIELENSRMLADKDIVSKSELALAQAKLERANAEVALAKFHVTATEVRAPFDGVIDRLPLKLGSLVDEGDLLTSLSDNSDMFAYFNVSEPEYLEYQSTIQKNKEKEQVSLLLANNKPLAYKGIVETVEGEFDNETGNIAFRARFPNPDRLLKNGETGKVQMTVPLHQALVIPQKATYEIQDKHYAYVVDAQGNVHSRLLEISNEMPDLYVVSSGLSDKDQILLEGVQKVKEDDHIQVKKINARDVLSKLRLKTE